jgi:putative transposase
VTGSKKNLKLSTDEKILLLEKDHRELPLVRQCELLGLARSTAYYKALEISEEEQKLLNLTDEIFTAHPYYGKRRISVVLTQKGYLVGVKKAASLMKILGLEAIYPRKKTTIPNKAHKVYPYLLRDVPIERINHVWSTDITYIRLLRGFVYLVAIIDWYSRFVLSWRLAITMETEFCTEALGEALTGCTPEIFNSDQGSQFTSEAFTQPLLQANVKISMDGKGRCLDNIFTERFWRTIKYEDIFIKDYASPLEAEEGIRRYIHFYNHERPHQSLNYKTPAQIYFQTVA